MKYLIRLDDACPTMHHQRWSKIEGILDKFGVRPMVGVIPNNLDATQIIDLADEKFWEKVKSWENKGWTIALHGYDHCYISNDPGINPIWDRSEFAGVKLEIQKDKIKKGVDIFRSHGINPQYFFAPSHTFDLNTLAALRECSDIRIISDTIGTKPYRKYGFIFVPQLGGHCHEIKINGIWTFCLHPSVMDDNAIISLETFLNKNRHKFISFEDLKLSYIGTKSYFSCILSFVYFTRRKLIKLFIRNDSSTSGL